MAKAKQEKKLNVYKVETIISLGADSDEHTRTDYVRAKTAAGAEKLAREAAVTVTATARPATPEDFLVLANVAVLGEKTDA